MDLPGLEVTGETFREPFFPAGAIPTDTRRQLVNFLTSINQRDVKTHSIVFWVLCVCVRVNYFLTGLTSPRGGKVSPRHTPTLILG